MAKKSKEQESVTTEQPSIMAIKGFDRDLKCRGYQFEVGKTFKHEGKVEACESGFHVITGHPLAVFNYYAPAGSVYHRVEISGTMHTDDEEKTAAEILKVGAQLGMSDLVKEAVKWVTDRSTIEEGASATVIQGAASATGIQGAASATGYRGAASATGIQGAASVTGYRGAASATGVHGSAFSAGKDGKVLGVNGNVLCAVERGDWDGSGYPAISTACGIVGKNGLKENVWYVCKSGELVEATS